MENGWKSTKISSPVGKIVCLSPLKFKPEYSSQQQFPIISMVDTTFTRITGKRLRILRYLGGWLSMLK